MIYSLRGKLTVKELGFVVIECGGVGYGCKTSYNTVAAIGEIGSEVLLYTHLYVREDAVELFGFASLQELSCFKLLISVSGVGPKAATSILSDVSPERFAFLIASGDSKAFTKTKGIGAKTAQRIVLELKDKIVKENNIDFSAASGGPAVPVSDGSAVSEAFSALLVLGYTQSEIAPVLAGLDQTLPSAELIRQALKIMAQRMNL